MTTPCEKSHESVSLPGPLGLLRCLAITTMLLLAGGSRAAESDGVWDERFGAPGVTPKALAAMGNLLYAGGTFARAGGTFARAGGTFARAGGSNATRVARWDGASWSRLGGGLANTVSAVAATETAVHVGGTFLTVGGKPSPYFGIWHPAMSVPVVGISRLVDGNLVLAWSSEPDRTYWLRVSSDLAEPFVPVGERSRRPGTRR